jgi:integrase
MRGHIRKRGAKWCVVVDIGRDESGRRRQKWHSGFESKRAAEAALTDIKSRLATDTYVTPSKETTGAFLTRWLDSKRASVRPTTLRSYTGTIEQYVRPQLSGIPVQRLSPAHLNALYADLLANGRRGSAGGLSPRTVRYVHTILRKALADALRWNVIVRNPADAATAPVPRTPEMTVWTAQEARRFLQGIKDDPLRALWTLALTTGMRRGELLGLKWTDVDLESARLSVRRSLAVVDGGPVESEPKTRRGRRSISLDESTVALLRQHRAEQAAQRLALGKPFTGGEYIFVSPDGHPIHPDTVTKRFQVLARRAKLPRIRFHDLRHTHATLALQAGVHPKVVSERLGHASTVITLDTYSHAVPALEEEAAARIASLLSGGAS